MNYLKNKHYHRNDKNIDLPQSSKEALDAGWTKLSRKASALHQHETDGIHKNSKWIDPTGKREVVFTGKGPTERIVDSVRDIGTYNYYSPITNPIGHAVVDVVPYYLWGNDPTEQSTFMTRLNESIDSLANKPLTAIKVPIANTGKKWAKSHRLT